jgi:hypothetical protein
MTPGAPCATRPAVAWPLSSAMPPLAALPTAPGCARADVRAVLAVWNMTVFTDPLELVVTELVTNAVRASAWPARAPLLLGWRAPVIRVCLFTDGSRLRAEIWDQASGIPALRHVPDDAENGRGLFLIDAITEGRWGWHPAPHGQPGKCTWAELEITGPGGNLCRLSGTRPWQARPALRVPPSNAPAWSRHRGRIEGCAASPR